MEFKEKLKILRNNQNFSRKELAEKTGISIRTIESYEQGNREPKESTIKILAEVLEVEPIELIKTLKPYQSIGAIIGQNFLEKYDAVRRLSKYPDKISDDLFNDIIRLFENIDKLGFHSDIAEDLEPFFYNLNRLIEKDFKKAEETLKKFNSVLEDDQ